MPGFLKQSTASQTRTIGPFVDDTDFKTLENGLTIANTDVIIKKNGAASGTKNSGGATADGSGGLYHLTWDATDTATVGELKISVKVAGALVFFDSYTVLEEAVYDMLFGASAIGYIANQPVDVNTIKTNAVVNGGTVTFPTNATLASTTNITAGTITTATTVTNQLTAAQIATGVWQDTTAGDFTVASSIGKTLYIANIAPGASGGLLISGSNAGTTTFGALTVTGATTLTGAVSLGSTLGVTGAITATNASNNLTLGTFTVTTNAIAWPAAWDAEVQSEVQDAIEANHLDHLLAADYDPASKPGTATALLNELIGSDAGVSQFTANALELAPTGGSAPTAAQIRAEIDANSTQLAAIVADTNELQTDWVNGGRLDLILDARASQTSVDDLPTNAELSTALGTADDAVLAAIAALSIPTTTQNATALLDLANGVESGLTVREHLRISQAAAAGKLSGAATSTVNIRDKADSKNRISATVDADGNRSAVTLDVS